VSCSARCPSGQRRQREVSEIPDVDVREVLAVHGGRLVADGVPPADVEDALTSVTRWADWFDHWMALSDRYGELGVSERAAGHAVTAGEFLWLSCMAAHYGQFLWFHDPAQRELGQRRKQERYADAAPLLIPAAERIDVEVDGTTVPGYLRIPDGDRAPVPLAVLLGGLESTKEEWYLFEELCLRRGLATFAFDGPGQGEYFFTRRLGPGFHRCTAAVIDTLTPRHELDTSRIGVVGRSLGGYYALESAAHDDRIAACVSWGGLFDLASYDAMDPLARLGFAYVAGYAEPGQAADHLRSSIDLAPHAPGISCPVYLLHGARDRVIGPDQLEKFERHLAGVDVHWDIRPYGNHCCHNLSHLIRPAMVDWLRDRLATERP
jgi:2,6-dihydroxypseudooxynicotine hydrolase